MVFIQDFKLYGQNREENGVQNVTKEQVFRERVQLITVKHWIGCLTTTVAFPQAASAGLDGGAAAGVTCGITWPASLLGARSTCDGTLRPFRPRRPAVLAVFSCTHMNTQAHLALVASSTIHPILTPPHPSRCCLFNIFTQQWQHCSPALMFWSLSYTWHHLSQPTSEHGNIQ